MPAKDNKQTEEDARDQWAPWERNFREQMARIREQRGMTQTDLARRLAAWGLPFHQQTVQRVESGQRPVRLNEALLICRELNVSLDSMTTTSAPKLRDMMFAVDRMRRSASTFAEELAESLSQWEDDMTPLGLDLSDGLQSHDENSPDPVLKYGFAWAYKAWDAFANAHNTLVQLTDIAAGKEVPLPYRFELFETMGEWWDLYSDLQPRSMDFPELPDHDSEA